MGQNWTHNHYARVDTTGDVDPDTLESPVPFSAVRQSDEEGWGLVVG